MGAQLQELRGCSWMGTADTKVSGRAAFLAQERRGAAQAVTVDPGHGQAEDRTGWECGFAHFW